MSDNLVTVRPDFMLPGYLMLSDFGVTFDGKTNDYQCLINAVEKARESQLLLTLPDGHAVKLWD